jgi:hypothetical protein
LTRAHASWLLAVVATVAVATAACGGRERNPVLGDWKLDRSATGTSAVLAVDATDLATLTLREDAIVSGGTVIPVTWLVEGARVRAVRGDGRAEHAIEVLEDERIRIELPIGVSATYERVAR